MQLKIAENVAEVVSGSLPKDQRKKFCQLLQTCRARGIEHIVVEGARTVARSAKTAQEFYEMSQAAGVTITAADIPTLYADSSSNPAQTFLRHVLFGYVQLERDMLVHRLQDGLRRKRKAAEAAARRKGSQDLPRTQSGRVKIHGCRTLVESKGWTKHRMQKELGTIFRKYQNARVSLRTMAKKISNRMKLEKTMAHETARRMFHAWAAGQ